MACVGGSSPDRPKEELSNQRQGFKPGRANGLECHRTILDVSFAVEGDGPRHAHVMRCRCQYGQILCRISRLGLDHGRHQNFHGIMPIRCIDLDIGSILGLEPGLEGVQISTGLTFHPIGFGTKHHIFGDGVTRDFEQFSGANAITAHELCANAQGLHLCEHRSCHRIHAAKKHQIRLLALDRGENRVEIGTFVRGEFLRYHLATCRDHRFAERVGQALAFRVPTAYLPSVIAGDGSNVSDSNNGGRGRSRSTGCCTRRAGFLLLSTRDQLHHRVPDGQEVH